MPSRDMMVRAATTLARCSAVDRPSVGGMIAPPLYGPSWTRRALLDLRRGGFMLVGTLTALSRSRIVTRPAPAAAE
jgi:hypothetical protein